MNNIGKTWLLEMGKLSVAIKDLNMFSLVLNEAINGYTCKSVHVFSGSIFYSTFLKQANKKVYCFAEK